MAARTGLPFHPLPSSTFGSCGCALNKPWEEQSHPLHNHHNHHLQEHCECIQLPALHDEPERAQPWPFQARTRCESAGRQLYLAESPAVLQSQSDAVQNQKRRRLLSDQIPQPKPHLSRPPADSVSFYGSGEGYDVCRQQPPPASPGMRSAHFDARGFLPAVLPKDDGACCATSCSGLACTRRRALISSIVAEVNTLNAGIQRITLQGNSQPRSLSSRVANPGTDEALTFVVDLLRTNVASLRNLTNRLSLPPGTGAEHQSASTAAATAEIHDVMKHRFVPITNQKVPLFLPQPTSGEGRDPSRTIPPPRPPEDTRRRFQGSTDRLSPRHSRPGTHPITNSGGAYHTGLPSHTASHSYHHPPPLRMLPSPCSLNNPPPPTTQSLSLPSLLPQHSSSTSAAHTAHLQDLQHQISLQTLALQTIREEYGVLLSKLDRQHTKCATLEKNFEVTDVGIDGLTVEKEQLEARVAALELQVEGLREQRDDARRREMRTGEQYRSIVEMAGKLQGMAAEEKRAWAQEREGLLSALGRKGGEDGASNEGGRRLEKGDVGGAFTQPTSSTAATMSSIMDGPTRGGALFDAANLPLSSRDSEQHASMPAAAAASFQVIAALRVEVAQLRSRTEALQTAIRSVCDQGTMMEEASQTIVETRRRMKEAAREAMDR